jgi:hypothetical protein
VEAKMKNPVLRKIGKTVAGVLLMTFAVALVGAICIEVWLVETGKLGLCGIQGIPCTSFGYLIRTVFK